MGLTVTGETKVYRQDKTSQAGNPYTQYSLGVASKDKDGNWVNGFLECQFKKGVEVANKAKIKINNAFYTVSEYNGKKQYKIFVMDFDVVEQGEGPTPAPTPTTDTFMAVPENMGDLPF